MRIGQLGSSKSRRLTLGCVWLLITMAFALGLFLMGTAVFISITRVSNIKIVIHVGGYAKSTAAWVSENLRLQDGM
jgi:hypothetical protein